MVPMRTRTLAHTALLILLAAAACAQAPCVRCIHLELRIAEHGLLTRQPRGDHDVGPPRDITHRGSPSAYSLTQIRI